MWKLIRRLLYLVRHERHARELAEEMEFHRALSGARAFGNATLAREDARSVWILPWLESVWQDLRVGARMVRKSPATTAQKVTVKLWDGTTVYTSAEAAAPSQGSPLTGYVEISLSKIVTLASTTTVKTTVASTAASILDVTPDDNGAGLTATANAIHAVRIGN